MSKKNIYLNPANSTYKSRLREKYIKDGVPEREIDIIFQLANYKIKLKVMEDYSPDNWGTILNAIYQPLMKTLAARTLDFLKREI